MHALQIIQAPVPKLMQTYYLISLIVCYIRRVVFTADVPRGHGDESILDTAVSLEVNGWTAIGHVAAFGLSDFHLQG
jgi:hypothetical protein